MDEFKLYPGSEVMNAIREIVDYNWADEERDFRNPEPGNQNSVFPALVKVREWLNATAAGDTKEEK